MTTKRLTSKPLFHAFLFFLLSSLISCRFQFNKKGEFKILQLTDQHYCESHEVNLANQNLTRYLLETIQPDLVVISGDAASGYAKNASLPGWYYSCWEIWTQPIMEYGIPYAYILGNHDAEGDLDREEIVELDQTNPLSVRSECEGIPSKSTFYVPIYSSRDQRELAANIWMFDSGRHGCGSHDNTWGCIDEEQLEWYDQASQQLKDQHGENVHHIAFLHIPIIEYMQIYNNGEIYGTAGEKVSCSSPGDSPSSTFFEHVKKNNDISAMFLGHDHYNDFGGWYQGVELVYGRKSGYGGYGGVRGARVINLKEEIDDDGDVTVTRDHYVIYENGTIKDTKTLIDRQRDTILQQEICPLWQNYVKKDSVKKDSLNKNSASKLFFGSTLVYSIIFVVISGLFL